MTSEELAKICKQAIVNHPADPKVEIRYSKDPLTAGCCQTFGVTGFLTKREPKWDVYTFDANELLKGCEEYES